jgi:hypothetical protein
MEECDFAILLLSPEFLSRNFIRDNELPWLYANKSIRLWDAETGCELDRRIYTRITLDGLVWATVDYRNNRILACHAEAWRILGWRGIGPDGTLGILPAETFGPLPVRGSQ